MKLLQRLVLSLFLLTTLNVSGQVKEYAGMKTFIDALMKKMTLDEKIGQLNLPGSGDIVTGQASNSDIGKKIKEGKVGGLFNIKGVEKIVRSKSSGRTKPFKNSVDLWHGCNTWLSNCISYSIRFILHLGYEADRTKCTELQHRSQC